MNSSFFKYFLFTFFILYFPNQANAFQYDTGRFSFRLNGYGTAGFLEPDFQEPNFINDWRIRTQMNYGFSSGKSLGLVYALDAAAVDENKFMREAFLFQHYLVCVVSQNYLGIYTFSEMLIHLYILHQCQKQSHKMS